MKIKKVIETIGLIIFIMIMLVCVVIPQWVILMTLMFIADILLILGKPVKIRKRRGLDINCRRGL